MINHRLTVLIHDLRYRGGVDSGEELFHAMRCIGRFWLLLRIWFAGRGVGNLPNAFNGRQCFVIEDVPVHDLAEKAGRNETPQCCSSVPSPIVRGRGATLPAQFLDEPRSCSHKFQRKERKGKKRKERKGSFGVLCVQIPLQPCVEKSMAHETTEKPRASAGSKRALLTSGTIT